MKSSQVLLALSIGVILLATVTARKMEQQPLEEEEEEEEDRYARQSDSNFPGPRRQNSGFESDTGRTRSRPRDPPVFVDFGGDVPLQSEDDGGSTESSHFQDEGRAPSRSFRPRHHQQSSISDEIGISGGDVGGKLGQQQELTEEEQKPEPDRLESLLKESKFSCSSKKPGYYADDGLSCEVFHYCNEGVRHSWMCPAGTNFHQIHLICMQEGGDNICKQSSKYYVVNDYLYKPLVDSTRQHNGTIRYADRYFPVDGEEPLDSDRGQGQSSFRGQDDGGRDQDVEQRDNDFRGGSDPQSQFYDPPPQRHSSGSSSLTSGGGGSRFRPSSVEEEPQFTSNVGPASPSFSSSGDGGSDDLGSSFAPEEDSRVHFLPPQNRFRSGGGSGGSGRTSSSRGLQFPLYDRES